MYLFLVNSTKGLRLEDKRHAPPIAEAETLDKPLYFEAAEHELMLTLDIAILNRLLMAMEPAYAAVISLLSLFSSFCAVSMLLNEFSSSTFEIETSADTNRHKEPPTATTWLVPLKYADEFCRRLITLPAFERLQINEMNPKKSNKVAHTRQLHILQDQTIWWQNKTRIVSNARIFKNTDCATRHNIKSVSQRR